jgi:hypothetical protein
MHLMTNGGSRAPAPDQVYLPGGVRHRALIGTKSLRLATGPSMVAVRFPLSAREKKPAQVRHRSVYDPIFDDDTLLSFLLPEF